MPRERSPNRDRAYEIYKQHGGNITNREIADLLNEDEKVIAVWKSRDKWNVVQHSNDCCTTKAKGGQPGNQNASGHGAPVANKNAEKHGFFSRYLPEETVSLIQEIDRKAPLDILWENIQLAYAAIIRAQQIAYVRDREDKTEEKTGSFDNGDMYMIQQAWDKQNNFLKAQARAQGELRSLIKQYDEMLHNNWEQASEEQKARIAHLKAQTDKLTGNNQEIEDLDDVEDDIYGSNEA
ncbi:MAG: terminase [Lachnospiraceae bacterium]|nr:terminase [Lachnospiraceae bacterium]